MKYFFAFLLFLLPFVSGAQAIDQHFFSFEGYHMRIVTAASDNKGTLLFAGTINAPEGDNIKKDPYIDSLMGNPTLHETYCIVLETDNAMKIRHISLFYNLYPSAIAYDPETSLFWLGCSRLTYDSARPEMFGKWQITLVRINTAEQKFRHSVVEADFSCRLENMIMRSQTLVLTAIQDSLDNSEKVEQPLVIIVATAMFHKQVYFPHLPTPDVLRIIKATTPPAGHVMLTTPSVSGKSSFYFGATAFPFGHVPTTGINIYQYKDEKLVQQPFLPDEHNLSLYNLTNCFVTKDANFVLAYIPYPDKKFYILAKVNAYMEVIWKQMVNDLQYPDFYNEVLELPDGKIAAAVVNKDQHWVYYIYSSDGALLKEIDSQQPVTLRPTFSKVWKDNTFICIFSPPSAAGASVVQLVNVN